MRTTLAIYLLLIGILFSCDTKQNIDGNYSVCKYGEYLEIYFKNDSMRVAKYDEWTKLTSWKKIKIKNDTLYFEIFGEWRDSTKAKIQYLENHNVKLHFLDEDKNLTLKPLSENIKINNSKEFWDEFKKRSKTKNCK